MLILYTMTAKGKPIVSYRISNINMYLSRAACLFIFKLSVGPQNLIPYGHICLYLQAIFNNYLQ